AEVSSCVPTVVVVFGSGRAFDPFRPRYQNKIVPVAGYFVQGPDANYVTLTLDTGDEGFRVICHEYTHFLVGNSVASVPVWLNEGLAEFYSTFALKSDGKTAFIGRVIPYPIETLTDTSL